MIFGGGHENLTHRVPEPVGFRPTWKGNLLMLVVALVVVFIVAS